MPVAGEEQWHKDNQAIERNWRDRDVDEAAIGDGKIVDDGNVLAPQPSATLD